MVEYIKENFSDLNWIWDKRIVNGISLRRPDLFLDLEDIVLNIECQENKHESYECICANRRTMELSLDIKHKI